MEKKPHIIQYLEQVAPFIPFPIYWGDTATLKVLGANQSCLEAMGARVPEDVIGKSPYDYYPREIADNIIEHVKKVIETKSTLSQEDAIQDITTGKTRYFTAIRSPLFADNSNEVVGIIGSSIEITAQKEAEQLRYQIQQQKIEQQQQFKTIVDQAVHDIGSPLMVLNFLVPKCAVLPENQRNMLNLAVSRIYDISRNLLNQAKVPDKDNQDNVKSDAVLISLVILEIIAEKRYEYSHLKIKFVTNISHNSYFTFINGNISDLKRMMSNLINNAVDALENRSGLIKIQLNNIDDKYIQIIVKDNGKSMSELVKDKILKNIAVTSGKYSGHGIGFTQINNTLNSNSGSLAIESEPDMGTKIIVTFPQTAIPNWICNQIKISSNSILVILDDEPSIHAAWQSKFEVITPKIECKHFDKGSDAINFVLSKSEEEKDRIFLLTDYELFTENLTGINIIEKTQVKNSILVTSHYNEMDIREQAKNTNTKILPKGLAAEVPIVII